MCEREVSKLWYLMAGIASDPTDWRACVELLGSDLLMPPSGELTEALDAFRSAMEAEPTPDRGALRRVGEALFRGKGPGREAGRAVLWTLESGWV